MSESMRRQHVALPWRQIIGRRNRLIHGYDSIDLDILWDVIDADLPPLIKQLAAILGSGGPPATPTRP